jgi:hypothetical protein
MEPRDTQRGTNGEPGFESASQARMRRRFGRRLPLGGLIGAIVGLGTGALVGFLLFDRSAAIVTSIFVAGLFGLGAGMLLAGYSSLESPDPGDEPSDTARPIADRPEAVREEDPDVPDPASGDPGGTR